MTEKQREVLKRVRRRLEGGAWTQRAYARDADGHKAPLGGEWACRWCLTGAVYCEIGPEMGGISLVSKLGGLLRREGQSVIDWNDAPERTLSDVLALLDRAIAPDGGERTECLT